MAIPFLVGVFSSIKKNAKGSVKEAVKRQNGALEKLRIKQEECAEQIEALRQEKIKCLKGLGGTVDRVREIEDKPKFDELSVSVVKLIPFDEKAMKQAADDPEGFLGEEADWQVDAAKSLSSPADADIAWDAMESNEKILNGWFSYYVDLQILADRYAHALELIRGLFDTHINVLDQFKSKNKKTDWDDFGEAQKMAFRNTVMLSKLLMEMCSVPIMKEGAEKNKDGINREGICEMLEKAEIFCGERGFEYDGKSYDVILRGSARNYFSYCYRLEDKLCRMLPISREQTAPILEKLRMESNVTISREVTHTHARLLMDQLRDIDIKTQRVISPDGSSIYYVELV